METPETPAQDEHKPGQKISAKKLWHSLKHSAKKGYHRLGTGGVIAISLGLILLIVIISYERRFDRIEKYHWHQPYRLHTIIPDRYDYGWMDDMEASWSRMHREFRDMQRRHEKMIQTLEEAPRVINDGQYSGYKTLNGNTLQYTLNVVGDTLTGTLLGTDTEALNRLRTELEKSGVTITNTNGNIQFTAPKEKLQTIVEIVNI